MPRLTIVDPASCADLRIDARPSLAKGDGQRFVDVVATEFPKVAVQYPIFVSKDAETGRFYCGAMAGFDPGENLFLEEGGDYIGYRPLNLQREPFFMLDGRLAIDLDSRRIGPIGGEALFDEARQPGRRLTEGRNALEAFRSGRAVTKAFIDELVELRLLTLISVDLRFDDGSERRLEDLYAISQEALRELGDVDALGLFRSGHLYLIHLMILSLQRIPVLAEIKNRRLSGLDGPGAYRA